MNEQGGKKHMGCGLKVLLIILGIIAAVIVAGWLWLTLNRGKIVDSMISSASSIEDHVGDKMPAFDVEQPDGTRLTRDGLLEGKELLAVVLYASWCKPCEKEFPEMDSVYQKYQDKMSMVGIDVDLLDTMEDVEKYAQSHNLTFPLAYGYENESLGFVKTSTFPTTILVDRNGTICFWRVGSIPSAELFEQLVTPFLGDDYTEHQPGYYTFAAYSNGNPVAGVEFSIALPDGTQQTYVTKEDGSCSVLFDQRADMPIKVLNVPSGVNLVNNGEGTTGLISGIVRLPVE